jgi:hypothetical protein
MSPRNGKRRSSFAITPEEMAGMHAYMQTTTHQRRASVCSNNSIDLSPIVPRMKDPLTNTPPPDHVACVPKMVNPFDSNSPRTTSPAMDLPPTRMRRKSSASHSRRQSTSLLPVFEGRQSPPSGDILEIAEELQVTIPSTAIGDKLVAYSCILGLDNCTQASSSQRN